MSEFFKVSKSLMALISPVSWCKILLFFFGNSLFSETNICKKNLKSFVVIGQTQKTFNYFFLFLVPQMSKSFQFLKYPPQIHSLLSRDPDR